jgi:uncharacterized membrane protein YeaQ/YmgE (transglycosylase-associated protein family)
VHCTLALFRYRRFRWLPRAKRGKFATLTWVARGLPASPGDSKTKHGSPPRRSGAMGLPIEAIVAWLVIGAIAGWLASNIITGGGLGLIGNIVVGIIGAFIAGWLFPFLWVPIGGPFIGTIINAVIGSIILLLVLGLLKRA